MSFPKLFICIFLSNYVFNCALIFLTRHSRCQLNISFLIRTVYQFQVFKFSNKIFLCYCRPYNSFVPFEGYWRAFEDIMKRRGGRPHWAKVCCFSPEVPWLLFMFLCLQFAFPLTSCPGSCLVNLYQV